MNRTLLACTFSLIPFAAAAAQRGMPMLPPVAGAVGNPAATDADTPPPMAPGCAPTATETDPATRGTLREGRDLSRAIATVTALPWFDDLAAARVEAAATGKPVLWLQALGELDGFA